MDFEELQDRDWDGMNFKPAAMDAQFQLFNWAGNLNTGDIVFGKICHKTDSSKDLANTKLVVVENHPEKAMIMAVMDEYIGGALVRVDYDELIR